MEKTDVFVKGQDWQIKIHNTDLGQADIFATSTVNIANKNYYRALKAKIIASKDKNHPIILLNQMEL